MEFFQEPTYFTAFLVLILTFVVAKIVSFAVSNSSTDGETIISSVNEGAVAKEATVDKGLRVLSTKGKKRVKFVDDVVIRRVDLYERSENLMLSDEVVSVGEAIVQEKGMDGKSGERVDDQNEENGLKQYSGGEISKGKCFDVSERHDADAQNKGSAEVEMLIEKDCDGDSIDGVFSENEKILVTSGPTSVIAEEEKNEEVLENFDVKIDKNEGNGVVGSGENEGLSTGDVEEEGKVRDESVDIEDDDWEGIERSELEKVFAEAVNYMEYGGKKNKDDDQLAKLSGDVQLELYGLHKVAVEGPCHEPQPMALKVSARSKWVSKPLYVSDGGH